MAFLDLQRTRVISPYPPKPHSVSAWVSCTVKVMGSLPTVQLLILPPSLTHSKIKETKRSRDQRQHEGMVSAKRRVRSLPHEVCRKAVSSRNREEQAPSSSFMDEGSVGLLCIMSFASKENKGLQFKRERKDKRNSSAKGFLGETIFFRINANWCVFI